jgi:DNA polymerase III subunit delta'
MTSNKNTIHDAVVYARARRYAMRMPFASIVGHRRLITLIARAIAQQTLPPSLLIAGPAGIGKRRVATAIAEAVNCLQPRTLAMADGTTGIDACGECAACRRIARGIHPDVLVVEPNDKGNIGVDEVRDPIDRSGYRPFEGRRRVVIVDPADALMPFAQNALLKTLEEPPSSSMFILVSSIADTLLPTVLSRCVRLRFAPLKAGEVADVLMRDHDYAEADARAAAADADGSVGQALTADSADLASARPAAQQLLEQAARVTDPARRVDAVKDLVGKKSTPAAERQQLAVCLRVAASLLRDAGVLASNGDARLLANPDLEGVVRRLATSYTPERAMRAFGAVDEALAALRTNASAKLVADWLVLRL